MHNIFGSIQPKIAIFTTPNGEFNVLFGPPRYENGFRHEDHKFEWTRAQFVDWLVIISNAIQSTITSIDYFILFDLNRALNICQRYPMYRVAFGGIGSPPDGMDWPAIGDCTQYACFVQKHLVDLLHQPEHPDDQYENEAESTESETSTTDTTVVYPIEKFPYKFLFSYEFPAYVETRSHVEVVMDSVKYFITRNSIDESRFLDEDRNALVIPVSDLFVCVHEAASEAELRNIIEKEYVLENDCIVHSMENEESDTSTDYDEDEDARENVDAVDGKDEDSW